MCNMGTANKVFIHFVKNKYDKRYCNNIHSDYISNSFDILEI